MHRWKLLKLYVDWITMNQFFFLLALISWFVNRQQFYHFVCLNASYEYTNLLDKLTLDSFAFAYFDNSKEIDDAKHSDFLNVIDFK